MKVSELIQMLEDVKGTRGDIDIFVCGPDTGGYGDFDYHLGACIFEPESIGLRLPALAGKPAE